MKFIAELCQNHNGSIDNVLKMADAAAESGATHLKIQHIYVQNLSFRPEFENGLTQDGITSSICRPWKNEYDRLKGLELSEKDCVRFVEHTKSLGLVPLTTCFTRGSVKPILDQGFSAVKVASYDCASFQMIRELASQFDYLYVSTGATYDDEVVFAVDILRKYSKGYTLLHCVTQYPTPLDMMHLKRISWLKSYADEVGFSDHSLVSRDGILAAKASIVCGADIIERHFTISKAEDTKDGPISVTQRETSSLMKFASLSRSDQLGQLNDEYPNWEIMLGQSQRSLSHDELLNRHYYRGRFATPRQSGSHNHFEMINNWEETPL